MYSRVWVFVLVVVLAGVATADAALNERGKMFDASKHKQVDRLVKPQSFNVFFLNWLAGPTEGLNNSLWCVGKAHANARPRAKVKMKVGATIEDVSTDRVIRLKKQSGKTNAAGRVEFFWEIPDIEPFAVYVLVVETTFGGKKIDGVWFHCFFGHRDVGPFPLLMGRNDRFAFRVEGGTPFSNSQTSGGFSFADGSTLNIDLADSSAGFPGAPIACHDPTLQFSIAGGTTSQAATADKRLIDRGQAINDMSIFADGFESGNTSAWSCAAP